MSMAAPSNRARRGRVMIVGDIAEVTRGIPQLNPDGEALIAVNNLFDALGQITITPPSNPIATIVLDVHNPSMVDGKGTFAIEAIRKIDPSVNIVLILPSDRAADNTEQWLAAGVDVCIKVPLAASDVHRLFDDDVFAGNGEKLAKPARNQNPPPISVPEPSAEVGSMVTGRKIADTPSLPPPEAPEASEPTFMPPTISNFPVPPPTAVESPRKPKGERASASSDECLGDTDLVESIMRGPNQLRDLAIRLMVQHTNWTDIKLEHAPFTDARLKDNNPQLVSCAVEFEGAHFGTVTTSQAPLALLQPWADWLARWLCLDAKFQGNRTCAMQDDLTCAGNRRFFDQFLQQAIDRASAKRRPLTLMVFDIDNFKSFNDQFGHDAGDEILRESVRLMQTVIRQGDRVCRIGGDEFAVIFADDEAPREPGSKHPESVETIAKRFQDQICKMHFPKLGSEAPGTLTISAGLATYPWDGNTPESLLRHADQLALESKRKGKNIITFGIGALRACRE